MLFPVIWALYLFAALVTLQDLVTLSPSGSVGIFATIKSRGEAPPPTAQPSS